MRRGVFVTGTGTGVGKTVACAALMAQLRRSRAVTYWKPVQTGIESDDDTAEVVRIASCSEEEVLRDGIRLPRPVSPHLAARLAGTRIDVAQAMAPVARIDADRFVIAEGAGGVLVPLNESETMTDLMTALDMPVVVVSQATLGTINHTLLTLEALRSRGIEVAGVIFNGVDAENRAAIEHFGRVRVLAELPRFDPVNPTTVGEWARSAPELGL